MLDFLRKLLDLEKAGVLGCVRGLSDGWMSTGWYVRIGSGL